MNIKFRSLLLVLTLLTALACSTKTQETDTQTEMAEDADWKEMDDYHMLMAESFHPYKDSANLEPAKRLAAELKASAEQWASAALPSKVDNENVKSQLDKLKNESTALADLVNNGDDQAIADQLTKVHDTFHGIQEAWYGGKGGHHHKEDH